jgi:type I restriction enzyme R subunit
MTKKEEEKVKLAAKELLNRLVSARSRVLVQDWYKDRQSRLRVRETVEATLDDLLPEDGYDAETFKDRANLVFELALDLAINNEKWAA